MIYNQLLYIIQYKPEFLVLFNFVFVNNIFCCLRYFNNVNLKGFNKILGSNIICNPN